MESNFSGVVVEPTPKAIAEGIAKILSNPENAKTLGTNAREVVYGDYSLEKTSKQILELYYSLAS